MFMSSFEMAYVRKVPFFERFEGILHDRTGILATVLFWNTIALVFGSVSLYNALQQAGVPGAVFWAGVLAAATFSVMGDFLPKVLVLYMGDRIFKLEVVPFLLFYYISYALFVIPVAKMIMRSRYSREEIIDMVLLYLRGKISEEDLRFTSLSIRSFYDDVGIYTVEGGDGCEYRGEGRRVLDVLRFMREHRCSRVRVDGRVFDLHAYLKRLSDRSLQP